MHVFSVLRVGLLGMVVQIFSRGVTVKKDSLSSLVSRNLRLSCAFRNILSIMVRESVKSAWSLSHFERMKRLFATILCFRYFQNVPIV